MSALSGWYPAPENTTAAAPNRCRSAGPLIGREAQHREIEAAVSRLSEGRSALVEISGDPGIGKTAVLAEVTRIAQAAGAAVFTGRPHPADGDLAFGAIVDALDGPLSATMRSVRPEGLTTVHGDVLAAVFPSLAAGGCAPPEAAAPRRAGHAVRMLLETLAASRPIALVLDDLHHADAGTIDVVSRLLSTPPRAPVLLAFAHRPRQASPRLRAAADTARELTRLHLEPLAESDALALIDEDLPVRWRRDLYRASEGNPGYLAALTDLLDGGPPGIDEADIAPVPPWFASGVTAEVARLSDTSRLVVAACSVLGDPLTVPLVAAVAELDEDDAYPAIDEIASHDLIRLVAGTGRFGFRHPLVRRAVYHGVSPGWRLAAHARVARLLTGGRTPAVATEMPAGMPVERAVERAPHVTRIATSRDRTAVALLAVAADEIEATCPRRAAQWRRAALDLLPGDDDDHPDGRVGLLLALGRACVSAGQPEPASDALGEALRSLPPGVSGLRTTVVAERAHLLHAVGRSGEARVLVRAELAHTRHEADRAILSYEQAWLETASGDPAVACDDAARACRMADRLGLRLLGCAARGTLAVAAVLSATPSAGGLGELPRAAAVLGALTDDELAARPDAPLWIGWAALLLERPHDAIRHLDRAVAVSRSTGRWAVECQALVARVMALCAGDRLAAAQESADEAAQAAWLSGSTALRSYAQAARCLVAARVGDLDTLRRRLAASGPPVVRGWPGALATEMVAEARLAAGDPDGCRSLLDIAGDDRAAGPTVRRYELLARAALDAGRPDVASRWATAAEALAARFDSPVPAAVALLARAQVLAATDAAAEAVAGAKAAFEAAATLDAAGLAWDAARARGVAEAANRCGREQPVLTGPAARPTSATDMTAAVTEHVVTESLMPSGPPGGLPGAALLTERERQIARLVSEGLKNREIADRLYVTQKTVEMHLSRIFAKLGVSNRVGVARALYATSAKS
ncbi:helix-turn-helix transcriptional regulator [Microbispora hainanensis]|uniref:helix-turn-helix transcriptional regulator n=1 Tax=Microbispora hainanensis TaxID=568844 RepID=UPI0033CE7D99